MWFGPFSLSKGTCSSRSISTLSYKSELCPSSSLPELLEESAFSSAVIFLACRSLHKVSTGMAGAQNNVFCFSNVAASCGDLSYVHINDLILARLPACFPM